MFKGNIILDHVEGAKNSFIVASEFTYYSKTYKKLIKVLPGWVTDGASVPRIFWNIFPPVSGRYLEAAVLHDALYKSQVLTKKESDKIFYEAMLELGTAKWKAWTIYQAVNLFGYKAWSENAAHARSFKKYVQVIINPSKILENPEHNVRIKEVRLKKVQK